MKSNVLFALLLIFSRNVFSQSAFSLQPAIGYGHLQRNTKDEKARMYMISLDINRTTSGKKFWEQAHRYPQIGLQFAASKSNDRYLGNIFTVIPYMEFNIWKSRFGILQIKHGTGLAYATRPYHEIYNPQNKLLGTKLNATSTIDLHYQIKLGNYLGLTAGVFLGHVSNGNLVNPNAGLNTVMGNTALVYFPNGRRLPLSERSSIPKVKSWHYRLSAITGLYDYQKELNSIKTNYQVSVLAFYQHGIRFRTGAGLEVSEITSGARPALYAEEEILIGHLATRYGLGLYFTAPVDKAFLYEKIGIAWYPFSLKNQVAEKFSIGAAIKAHAFKAAHVEISAGYTF